jgi:hypothetical protein
VQIRTDLTTLLHLLRSYSIVHMATKVVHTTPPRLCLVRVAQCFPRHQRSRARLNTELRSTVTGFVCMLHLYAGSTASELCGRHVLLTEPCTIDEAPTGGSWAHMQDCTLYTAHIAPGPGTHHGMHVVPHLVMELWPSGAGTTTQPVHPQFLGAVVQVRN